MKHFLCVPDFVNTLYVSSLSFYLSLSSNLLNSGDIRFFFFRGLLHE